MSVGEFTRCMTARRPVDARRILGHVSVAPESDHHQRSGLPPVDGPLAVAPLGVVADAQARAGESLKLAARHIDQSFVDVLRIIGFDTNYTTAKGSYVYDTEGHAYLDMHTGEGFASLGHSHPDVREVLHATLDAELMDGVQIHYSVLAGMLAEALATHLPAGLDAMYFCSAGAEAVDSAMKFARAATGRPRFVSCESGYHGVSLGPLSLVGDEFFKEDFGPLLPGCALVPYGDIDRLEAELRYEVGDPVSGELFPHLYGPLNLDAVVSLLLH